MARRLATIAAVGLGVISLSGCHEVARVYLGGDDPPVHNTPIGPALMAAKGRAFTGTADGKISSTIRIKHGFVKSTISNARFIGTFKGKLSGAPQAGDELLGPLASAKWHGQLTATRNRATKKIALSGLVLATFTDPAAGRACLRLKYKNSGRSKNKGTSMLSVVGGEGGARRLGGTASVRTTIAKDTSMRLKGTFKAASRAERGFSKACTKLERAFKLTPLAG